MRYDVRYSRLFIDLFLHPLNSQFPTTWRYGSCSGKWGVTCMRFSCNHQQVSVIYGSRFVLVYVHSCVQRDTLEMVGEPISGMARCPYDPKHANVALFAGL